MTSHFEKKKHEFLTKRRNPYYHSKSSAPFSVVGDNLKQYFDQR